MEPPPKRRLTTAIQEDNS